MGHPNRLTCLLSASFAVLTANGVAHAQQSPAPAAAEAPRTEVEESDEIIVLAEPGDQVRIDRRTYTLRDDPVAQSTDMFDILGRIPSVSVAPTGEITLMGASNVTIQINGQPVPGGNLEQILRGLPGGSVERIEVISNPSAQYSAQASGGIINIITLQRHEAGASGSASVGANSAQGYLVNVGPSWARGPWSVSLWAGMNHNESERAYGRVRRDIPLRPRDNRYRRHRARIRRRLAGCKSATNPTPITTSRCRQTLAAAPRRCCSRSRATIHSARCWIN
ncbi:MAG: TonB-dependent receptor plug domain-containing protein [Caulobacteraceae bacterium]|nr:TonB-dependent receptor plug domain-containing protein [Caulobacteraceae bacterium]